MLRRTLRLLLVCVATLPFVTACGGAGSSGAIDVPSITASFSPTRERPGPTTTAAPETSTPPDTSAPAPTSPAQTANPTLTPAPTGSPSAAPTETATGTQTSGGDGWWWLLIVILVVGAVVTWLLLRQARGRRAWETRFSRAERETGWLARDLIPQLRGSGTVAGVSGGWAVAAPRVAAIDDELSQLVATAPGDEERTRATALRDAVRDARDRVVAVVAAGETSQWALDLDDAQAPLLAVLVPPPSGGGAHSAG